MFNKVVAVAAVACLAVSGIASANGARIAAEQATKILEETQAGRQFAEALGIKFPKEYATFTRAQKDSFLSKVDMNAVARKLDAKPEAQGVLSKLAASTKGLTGKQAEAAAVKVVSTDGAALLVQAQSGPSVMNQVMGNKTTVAEKDGQSCKSDYAIPSDVKSLLGFYCQQPLSVQAKDRAVELFREAQADGTPGNDAAQVAQAVGGKQGLLYLIENCLSVTPGFRQQALAL